MSKVPQVPELYRNTEAYKLVPNPKDLVGIKWPSDRQTRHFFLTVERCTKALDGDKCIEDNNEEQKRLASQLGVKVGMYMGLLNFDLLRAQTSDKPFKF